MDATAESQRSAGRDSRAGAGRGAKGRIGALFHLSSINKRRWKNFKANRRGYWSLWIFLVLFVISLLANFIANDRPILVSYKGELLMPALVDYPESKFDGFLATTDYKDPVIAEEIKAHGWMLWPPIRYSDGTVNKDYPTRKSPSGLCLGFPAPPPWVSKAELCETTPEQLARYEAFGNTNWLGTDDQGRDVVARVIYGFRISVLFGLILTFFSSIVGIAAGAVQGYFGGRTDLIFQRILEIWGSTPELYVIIILFAILGRSFWLLVFVMILFSWPALVGVVRAEFLRARNFEYVRAARALGVRDRTIIVRHVLPNAMVATLTFLPFIVTGAISSLAGLDYLGFGLPSSLPSLGELALQGKNNLQAPWLGLSAFFTYAIMLSLLVFIFEGVRDAFDPRKTFK